MTLISCYSHPCVVLSHRESWLVCVSSRILQKWQCMTLGACSWMIPKLLCLILLDSSLEQVSGHVTSTFKHPYREVHMMQSWVFYQQPAPVIWMNHLRSRLIISYSQAFRWLQQWPMSWLQPPVKLLPYSWRTDTLP